jgi:shikimate kinase
VSAAAPCGGKAFSATMPVMKSPMTGNIFLVGLMGAGKTTIGRQLSKLLDRPFVDSDQEIEQRTGVRIPVIFEVEGEAGFRQRERAMIAELTARRGIILATGGGAVLDADNRRRLKENGLVVYLRAAVADLLARTRHDRNRPLLQTADPRQKLEQLLAQRDPLYREVADLILDTGQQSANQLTRQLERELRQLS